MQAIKIRDSLGSKIKFRSGAVYAIGETGQAARLNGNPWYSKAERKAYKKAQREERAAS